MPLPKLTLDPDSSAYSGTPGEQVLAVAVQNGPSRRRLDFIGASHMIEVSWVLSATEYQYMMAFRRTRLKNGVLPFLMDLPLDDAVPTEYTCNFVPGTFGLVAKSGDAHTVRATIEARPQPTDANLDEQRMALFEAYGNYGGTTLDGLAHLVNIDLPDSFG